MKGGSQGSLYWGLNLPGKVRKQLRQVGTTAGTGQWWAGQGLVDGEVSAITNDFGVSLVGANVALGVGNPDTTITSSNAVNDGNWHHVAATRDAVSGQMLIYVDDTLQASGPGPIGMKATPPFLRIGASRVVPRPDFSVASWTTCRFLAGSSARQKSAS